MGEDVLVHGRHAVLCAYGWHSILAATGPDAYAALMDVLSCFRAARMRAAGVYMQANAVVFSLVGPLVDLFRDCITDWADSIFRGGESDGLRWVAWFSRLTIGNRLTSVLH